MDKELHSENWHYNFRDKKQLADLSVLQREFYITIGAVSFAALVVLIFVWGLISSFILSTRVSSRESSISERIANNTAMLDRNTRFQAGSLVIENLRHVYEPAVSPLDFLTMISATAPKALIFNNINFNEDPQNLPTGFERYYNARLEGFTKSTDDVALATINTFSANIMEMAEFKEMMEDFEVAEVRRDSASGMVKFAIIMKLRGS